MQQQPASSISTLSALPEAWIKRLFERMEDRYGTMWADRYGPFPRERVMATWAADLADMSRDELARGVTACLDRPYPPTLPEFRALCRPPIDQETAHAEAVLQLTARQAGLDRWSSPVVFWAAVRIGSHDMLGGLVSAKSKRWAEALRQAAEEQRCRVLPPIPPARPALPAPTEACSPEIAESALRRAREMLANGSKRAQEARKRVGEYQTITRGEKIACGADNRVSRYEAQQCG